MYAIFMLEASLCSLGQERGYERSSCMVYNSSFAGNLLRVGVLFASVLSGTSRMIHKQQTGELPSSSCSFVNRERAAPPLSSPPPCCLSLFPRHYCLLLLLITVAATQCNGQDPYT